MTPFNLSAITSHGIILVAGEHPDHGVFLVVVEHRRGWPTFVTAIIDGDVASLKALGPEVADAVTAVANGILVEILE